MDPKRDPGRDSPPEKTEPPPSYGSENNPDLTVAFAKLNLDHNGPTPSTDECIAHLKFLEAINQLREDVATQDGLYGLNDSLVSESNSDRAKSQALAKLREKRWAVYVNIAVKRFEAYFQTLQPGSRMMDIETMKGLDYEHIVNVRQKLRFDLDNLPPLGAQSTPNLGKLAYHP